MRRFQWKSLRATWNCGRSAAGLLQRIKADDRHQWRSFLDRICRPIFINPNCLIRVLAASRQQVVEADFSETLIPFPTISITNPANYSTYLVGTNYALTITVNAQAGPGASIQEVDYSYV